MPSWKIIAKNEFRIMTSRFNKHRKSLVLSIIIILCTYSIIIPMVISWIIGSIPLELVNYLILFLPTLILFAFAGIFIYSLVLPLSNTLQDIQKGQLEVIISSPIRPRQILFGVFLGRMFNYSLIIVILGVPLLSLLVLVTSASPLIILIALSAIIALFLVGYWIGTILAAFLQARLSKISKGRDIGRALTFIFSFVIFIGIYGILFFIQSLQDSYIFNIVIQIIPSSWVANIITSLILGVPTVIDPLTSIILILSFTVIALYLGYRYTDRIYNLEPVQSAIESVKKEGPFFKILRRVLPANIGITVIILLKDFIRRLENISKIGYAIAISIVIMVVSNISIESGAGLYEFSILLPSTLFNGILTMLIGSDFTVKGKDKLWVYKKSPNGITRLIVGKIIQLIIIVLPLAIIMSLISSIINGSPINFILINLGLNIFYSITFSIIVVGIFSANPVFEERSSKFSINMLIVSLTFFIPIQLFLFLTLLAPALFGSSIILNSIFFYLSICIISIIFGQRRLSRLE